MGHPTHLTKARGRQHLLEGRSEAVLMATPTARRSGGSRLPADLPNHRRRHHHHCHRPPPHCGDGAGAAGVPDVALGFWTGGTRSTWRRCLPTEGCSLSPAISTWFSPELLLIRVEPCGQSPNNGLIANDGLLVAFIDPASVSSLALKSSEQRDS